MISVILANYIKDYKIRVAFNDGKSGVIDLASTLKNDHRKTFQELLDKEKFKHFKIDADTIVWDNGLDLAPEFLKDILQK